MLTLGVTGAGCRTVTIFKGYRQLSTGTVSESLSPIEARTPENKPIAAEEVGALYGDIVVVAATDRMDRAPTSLLGLRITDGAEVWKVSCDDLTVRFAWSRPVTIPPRATSPRKARASRRCSSAAPACPGRWTRRPDGTVHSCARLPPLLRAVLAPVAPGGCRRRRSSRTPERVRSSLLHRQRTLLRCSNSEDPKPSRTHLTSALGDRGEPPVPHDDRSRTLLVGAQHRHAVATGPVGPYAGPGGRSRCPGRRWRWPAGRRWPRRRPGPAGPSRGAGS